jgi:hypothetical protein
MGALLGHPISARPFRTKLASEGIGETRRAATEGAQAGAIGVILLVGVCSAGAQFDGHRDSPLILLKLCGAHG